MGTAAAPYRQQLVRLLGKLPPRPVLPEVKILSRQDKGAYVVEKFEFDNDAGAMVPGYILIPKTPGPAKRPASSIAIGMEASMTLAKRRSSKRVTPPNRPARRWRHKVTWCLPLTRIALANGMAKARVAPRSGTATVR
jgi:hypothetical protein